jgi:23S rRNA pseudouridine2605 synthase
MEEKKRRPRLTKADSDAPLQERDDNTNDQQNTNFSPSQDNNYRAGNDYERRPYQDRSQESSPDITPEGGGYQQRPYQDRPQGGGYQQRPYQDRPQGGGYQQRPYQDRPQGGGYQQRPYQERPPQGDGYQPRPYQDRNQGGGYQQRPWQDRNTPDSGTGGGGYQPRPYQDRSQGGGYQQRPYQDRQQGGGGGYQQRPYQDRQQGGDGGGGYQQRPWQDRQQGGDGGGGYQQRPYQDRQQGGGGGYQQRPYQDRQQGGGGGGYQQRGPGGGGYGGGGGYQQRGPGGGGYGGGRPQQRGGFNNRPQRGNKRPKNEFYVEKLPKPDLPTGEGMPLNKFLAHCGISSRRKAVEFIEQGKVTVNGLVVQEPYYRYQIGDHVTVDGVDVTIQERLIYVLLNKPKGAITTTEDERGRSTIMDIVDPHFPERIYPVGRLDRDTTGLILLTNDGELAQKLTHPSHHVQKQYRVGLDQGLTREDYDKILAGVELEDGEVIVNWLRFAEDHPMQDVVELEITMGRNRVVRRLFEVLGYQVKRLDRFYFAGLTKKDLARGAFRELTQREVIMLKHFTGHPSTTPKDGFESSYPVEGEEGIEGGQDNVAGIDIAEDDI